MDHVACVTLFKPSDEVFQAPQNSLSLISVRCSQPRYDPPCSYPGGSAVRNQPVLGGGDPLEEGLAPTAVFLPGEPMGRGAWRVRVHGIPKSWTQPSNWARVHTHTVTHTHPPHTHTHTSSHTRPLSHTHTLTHTHTGDPPQIQEPPLSGTRCLSHPPLSLSSLPANMPSQPTKGNGD